MAILTHGSTSGTIFRWSLGISLAIGFVAAASDLSTAATYSVNTRNVIETGLGIGAATLSDAGPTTSEAWNQTKGMSGTNKIPGSTPSKP